ncbi:alpha-ribazole phosphatase [Labilibacter marinus]|uniref:alpha-ribazole phosphatase n=1 Tax=Labilibacter marinus TaxID=1477105 RepID=UPI00094F7829|nr:alpha-ribazole phosphatase [Labilibacter marinus]
MKEVYLIRHTTPDIKAGLCYGSSDIDVINTFEDEALSIQQSLKLFEPQQVYSSPLMRCDKLSSYLFPTAKIVYDDRIKEMHFGDWELKPWADIDEKVMKSWSADFVNSPTPNGENFEQLFQRSNGFINDRVKNSNADKIAIVTHSGVIRCLLSRFLEIPLLKIFQLKLNYGAVVKLTLHSNFEEVEFIK